MWKIETNRKVQKQVERLPKRIKDTLLYLIKEIEEYGPVRGKWPNYSSLGNNRHHCHLKKGKPTYVAVWTVIDKKTKLVELSYVGTHENAPY
jgi:mRNA-degrading endonuclease RelE of RelBE toxin-antitoxin system